MKGKYPNGLKAAMAEAGIGPTELARLAQTSKQNIQRWADAERKLPIEWAERIAPLLDKQPEELFFPRRTVPVVGVISAGGTIESATDQVQDAEPLFEIEVPFPVPADAFALQIKGESMWPRYDDGDVIICHRHSQDPAPLVGWEAAVGTPEGNRYLKRLMRGSREGLFTLESHNAPPIRDAIIAWASEVFGVVRAARWRRLDDRSRRREIRKAVA